eukprot:TRINITY_DN1536_c0_g1_i1.p1 TRINITY_DN1536_c0_g1~~TRINITY_DN1536_c0_g1_i1.p1  ORF type:complete len:442 (-),score=137.62 TRINITY_DN1536_c0_g1_i1:91-1221(-)
MGKDVTSSISLPVWIFEPHSFLQIMCEPFQYAELLKRTADSPDSINRMAYLIAFVTAGYSCAVRQKKPFNPILGETYEYIPANKSYRFFAEQVSHHPPVGVCIAEGEGYTIQMEMGLKTKFTGNSTEAYVSGETSLKTTKYGDEFTWGHLDTCAHNIIVGWMWVDHFGTLNFTNKKTGDSASIVFSKCGWLGAGRYELSGNILDKNGKIRMKIFGKWNEYVSGIRVDENGKESQPITIWKKPIIQQQSNKWGWSKFNLNMNMMSDAYRTILPPTDSRVRTDRYYLEKEDLETSGAEKKRLEEKQRAERRQRETNNEHWEPKYFTRIEEGEKGYYQYTGKYWEEREERLKKADYVEEAVSPSLDRMSVEFGKIDINE